ncbi:CD209 antigen-like protein C isoform X2 [Paralichthys olivaceus]|uniref:CD209 antigen-like protein C isoform X2 n=1 Tax=Paralichthys olivaceus TaxID=8255 RepID=UPI0037515506
MEQQGDNDRATFRSDQRRAPRTLQLVAAVSGILCLVLGLVIIVFSTSDTSGQDLQHATAQNLQLRQERDDMRRRAEELSRERDRLNWTIGVILQHRTFPVKTHCPGGVCRTCLDGWIPFQSSCYWFYESNRSINWESWQDSRDQCRDVEADLVVIESSREQEFINNHTKAYDDEKHGYWIGLSKMNDVGTWMWVDGSNVTLKYWTAEPGYKVSCALSLPRADPQANWKRSSCYMWNRWICETRALNKPD